jgi:uncharacterized membrane protein YwzB
MDAHLKLSVGEDMLTAFSFAPIPMVVALVLLGAVVWWGLRSIRQRQA